MSNKERYRNEWKYLIDTAQKELICRRLEPVMELPIELPEEISKRREVLDYLNAWDGITAEEVR